MNCNPYRALPNHQFWRRAVAGVERFEFDPVVSTRFRIQKEERVATAGSCFAQHISSRLNRIGFNYYVVEDGAGLPDAQRNALNYGVFSCRYGNIYTTRQLLQLFQACFHGRPAAEDVWAREDGRFVDALRPQIDPAGFATAHDVRAERILHLAAVKQMFLECDVFVFTLGLTECWRSRLDGTVYPLAPGVAGGCHDPDLHEFVNLGVHDVLEDLEQFIPGLVSINPDVKIILTVSPVPLIATYENRNALVATTYSKSVLRVAADMLYRKYDLIEYFPSYEIITGNYSDSVYYERDYRSVNIAGVNHAMRCFLDHFTVAATCRVPQLMATIEGNDDSGIVCDEEAIDQIRV